MSTDISAAHADALPNPLLTVQQAAAFLNVTTRTARRMIKDGRLPAIRLGRMVRIRPEDLAALVTGQTRTKDDNNQSI